ncbi:MAG: hypothetical protein ACE5D7_00820 [Fidelibacterota bacterium]
MKYKLKAGVKLPPGKNKHGLPLSDYYRLRAGGVINVTKLPAHLSGLVVKVKGNK